MKLNTYRVEQAAIKAYELAVVAGRKARQQDPVIDGEFAWHNQTEELRQLWRNVVLSVVESLTTGHKSAISELMTITIDSFERLLAEPEPSATERFDGDPSVGNSAMADVRRGIAIQRLIDRENKAGFRAAMRDCQQTLAAQRLTDRANEKRPEVLLVRDAAEWPKQWAVYFKSGDSVVGPIPQPSADIEFAQCAEPGDDTVLRPVEADGQFWWVKDEPLIGIPHFVKKKQEPEAVHKPDLGGEG